MKRKLRVDVEELEMALQADFYEMRHYLDLETGEIVMLTEEVTGDLDQIYGEIYDEEGNRTVSLEAYLEKQDYPDWEKEMLLAADRVEQGYRTRYIVIEKALPEPVVRWLKAKHSAYARGGRVQPNARRVEGTSALVFCTYSGQHTGVDEAIPAGLYAGQFFAHLGIRVLDEWYVVGEYHGREEANTKGCLGDIRGRPNAEDLRQVKQRAWSLARRLRGAAG